MFRLKKKRLMIRKFLNLIKTINRRKKNTQTSEILNYFANFMQYPCIK